MQTISQFVVNFVSLKIARSTLPNPLHRIFTRNFRPLIRIISRFSSILSLEKVEILL